VGVIPLKIQEEISAIELVPHRWMQGTKHLLEQLMTPYELRSVSSNHGAREMALPYVQIKGTNDNNA